MHHIIFIVAIALLTGCKSHKDIVIDKSLDIDSVARSEHHRTIAVIDSAIRHSDFSFDSLKIVIERPTSVSEAPEVIRLKAVKGRVIDRRKLEHNQIEYYNRLDTVAYKQSAVESSTEHSATARLYNPPDGTLISVFAILIAGILVYLFYRKK